MANVNTLTKTATQVDGRIRCAIYARYSSDNQRKASIEGSGSECREAAEEKGWVVLDHCIFWDEEKSGTTVFGRNGFQTILNLAKTKPRPFDYIFVADTSRFGRNKADAFKNVELLNFHQVYLYFVEDELDSGTSWFDEAFHQKAQRDQQFSISLGKKFVVDDVDAFLRVSIREAAVMDIEMCPEEDFSRKGEYGRPAVIGVRQVIDPEEARIVRRIFEAYGAGMSLLSIAKMLNSEGIPTSQNPRTRRHALWCKSAIQEMLKNTRYCGKTYWGRTVQIRDPETGKWTTRGTPESEWEQMDLPELRIISDELWSAVEEQLRRATRGIGAKRLGGMSRTDASKKYLFSGLLKCGLCGGNMIITATNPPAYGCASHRNSGICSNRMTIKRQVLEEHMLAALASNLRSADLHEELVQTLTQHLNQGHNESLSDKQESEQRRSETEAIRRKLALAAANLVKAIRESGHSKSILLELAEVEARIERIDEFLAEATKPAAREFTKDEVRLFLSETVDAFAALLSREPQTVKHELQKRITSLTLTPQVTNGVKAYLVSGDVGSFLELKM